jgi:hypothetical protein
MSSTISTRRPGTSVEEKKAEAEALHNSISDQVELLRNRPLGRVPQLRPLIPRLLAEQPATDPVPDPDPRLQPKGSPKRTRTATK